MVCPEFSQRNHIKLKLHENHGGRIICTTDKPPIGYPPEYFRGTACEAGGRRIFVMDPRYMLLKERQTIRAGTSRHPERHQEMIRRLELWLVNRAEQFPLEPRRPYRRPTSRQMPVLSAWAGGPPVLAAVPR